MSKFLCSISNLRKTQNYVLTLPIIKKIQPSFGHISQIPLFKQVCTCPWRNVNKSCASFTGRIALGRRNQNLILFRCPQKIFYSNAAGIPGKQFCKNVGSTGGGRLLRGGRGRRLRLKLNTKQMRLPPVKPDPSDCCGQGCNPCILDVYEEQLRKFTTCCKQPTTAPLNCLSQTSYSVFKLITLQKDSKDTNLYTFKFVKRCDEASKGQDCRLCFKAGQYFFLRGPVKDEKGNFISRPYTVLHNYKDFDYSFDALIKIVPDGKLTSTYVANLQPGDLTFWRGPYGKYKINYKLKNILMIAIGTGITPMYDIANDIIHNEQCDTSIKLYFLCKNYDNINMRYQLHDLSDNWNFTYSIYLGEEKLDKPKLYREKIYKKWLNEEDLKEYFKKVDPEDNFQVLLCGLEPIVKTIEGYLEKFGVRKDNVKKF